MEVKKKRKKVILQIGMICAFIFSFIRYIPDVVYADTSSVDWSQYWYRSVSVNNEKYVDGYKTTASGKHVTFYSPNCFYTCIISTTDLSSSGSRDKYEPVYGKDGPCFIKSEEYPYHEGSFTYNGVKYFFIYSGTYGSVSSYRYVGHLGALYDCPVGYLGDAGNPLISNAICDYIAGHLPYTCKLVCDGGEDGEVSTDVGSVNNPIEDDKEIGIPIITKRRYTTVYHDTDMGNASDGKEDIDDSQFIFDWSNKTSTGFNLKKNKYHMTRIQIKVQSKCVVYSGFSHKTVKKRFENYGEMSSEIKSALVDDTPYSIEYGTVKSMLPKTFSEKHNPLYVGRNFTFYFRVMCNESASGTGKWHCGAWRAVGLNASTTQDQTDESSNGHIDSDGNYTKDPDDGHNNSDSDSSTVDDKEDAKDQFKDDQKNDVTNGKNDSSGFEWSDLKKLVNECKEVPALIKSIFSFLPDWVLVFVAVGFGIWIFVLIKRAIA